MSARRETHEGGGGTARTRVRDGRIRVREERWMEEIGWKVAVVEGLEMRRPSERKCS